MDKEKLIKLRKKINDLYFKKRFLKDKLQKKKSFHGNL